jgi:hypothetical protein
MAAATTSSPKTSPSGRKSIGADDEAGAFVTGVHQLEGQVGGFGFEGDVADFVDDQQGVTGQSGEFGLQGAAVVGGGQPVDPLGGGGEQDAVAGLAGRRR